MIQNIVTDVISRICPNIITQPLCYHNGRYVQMSLYSLLHICSYHTIIQIEMGCLISVGGICENFHTDGSKLNDHVAFESSERSTAIPNVEIEYSDNI